MIGYAKCSTVTQNFCYGIRKRFAGIFVLNNKYLAKFLPCRLILFPTGQLFGNNIHELYNSLFIRCDYRIADTAERCSKPALLFFRFRFNFLFIQRHFNGGKNIARVKRF